MFYIHVHMYVRDEIEIERERPGETRRDEVRAYGAYIPVHPVIQVHTCTYTGIM